MKSFNMIPRRLGIILAAVACAATQLAAQSPASQRERAFVDQSGAIPWFSIFLLVTAVAGVAGFLWWRKGRPDAADDPSSFENRVQERRPQADDRGVDAEKELEWFRKAKKSSSTVELRSGNERRTSRRRLTETSQGIYDLDKPDITSTQLQDKLKRLQYSQLPINSFIQLTEARTYEMLPLSSDPALLSAIEQANEEFEEDESVRELAVKILAAFKNRNSVESLAQIALYDLSAHLRSKAVTILTEFDHESVFETVLLACADPTREVRAAAARGLFRLSFDRAEAWKRLIAAKDEFRMRQAARAAIESGILQKSLDRLIHDDMRIAYEAFTLTAMLIKAGEVEPILTALRDHRDERVRMALLHVLKIVKDEASLVELEEMVRYGVFAGELLTRANEAVKALEPVAAT